MKAEEDSQKSQCSQQHDTSSEVHLSLQPGRVPRPEAEEQQQRELNLPTSSVFAWTWERTPKESSGPVDSQQASKSCDQQDLTVASGKVLQYISRRSGVSIEASASCTCSQVY